MKIWLWQMINYWWKKDKNEKSGLWWNDRQKIVKFTYDFCTHFRSHQLHPLMQIKKWAKKTHLRHILHGIALSVMTLHDSILPLSWHVMTIVLFSVRYIYFWWFMFYPTLIFLHSFIQWVLTEYSRICNWVPLSTQITQAYDFTGLSVGTHWVLICFTFTFSYFSVFKNCSYVSALQLWVAMKKY